MKTEQQEPRPRPSTTRDDRSAAGLTGIVTGTIAAVLVSLSFLTGSIHIELAVVGLIAALGAAVVVSHYLSDASQRRLLVALADETQLAATLVADNRLFLAQRQMLAAITGIARHPNDLLRELATNRIADVCDEVDDLARGRVTFDATETWRAVYEDILWRASRKIYYSVAWVRSPEYWSDAPGLHGMKLNFQLAARGYRIERVVILPDSLWPYDRPQPVPEIADWLNRQHQHGIQLSLVREHELVDEPELLCDFGIYGDQAVGYQHLDEHSRTARFHLEFGEPSRQSALERWKRLALYATPYTEILDPDGPD